MISVSIIITLTVIIKTDLPISVPNGEIDRHNESRLNRKDFGKTAVIVD